MQELLQKRVELLKEKEELLKERQMIANQSKQGAAPTAQRPKEPAVPPAKRAEDLMSAVNGNIFQGGDTGAKKTSNKKKEEDEAGFFGREFHCIRGVVRTNVPSRGRCTGLPNFTNLLPNLLPNLLHTHAAKGVLNILFNLQVADSYERCW
jgi:hypothetical protein